MKNNPTKYTIAKIDKGNLCPLNKFFIHKFSIVIPNIASLQKIKNDININKIGNIAPNLNNNSFFLVLITLGV